MEYKEKIESLRYQKNQLENDVKTLNYIKQRELMSEKEKKEKIKEDLSLDTAKVFLKNELTETEIEILKEEGFKQSNEYCIQEKRNVSVFTKQVLNHSSTHTFLVWSIMDLILYRFDGISKLKEHETKDADITFKYKNRFYAIEIETGSLLKKKRQAQDKVEYLNKRYKNRWMFVVTNKNLLSEYKKLGFATQRTQVEKSIKKLLKIDTQ